MAWLGDFLHRYPSFMTSLDLAAFVAMVGLHAGPAFIETGREVGFGLVLGGAVVTLTPLVAGLFFGRDVLRMGHGDRVAGRSMSTLAVAQGRYDRAG